MSDLRTLILRVQAAIALLYGPRLTNCYVARFYIMEAQTTTSAKFSAFAIIAIVAAVLSFATGAVLGLVFAMVAILFGVMGMLSAMRSSVRGGFVGMLSIFAGVVGIAAAVLKAIAWFF